MLNNIDKIYVCHYTKLVDRKKLLLNILSDIGLSDVYWVEEFDKEDIDDDLLIKYPNITKPLLGLSGIHYNRTLRLSEISLLFKHRFVWEDSVKNNYDNILVLEDDVIFSNEFVINFNKQIKEVPTDYDIIWIGSCCNLHANGIVSDKYIYENKGSRCTHGYMISKKCCEKMLEHFNVNNYPADFMFNVAINRFGLKNYWMEPDLIQQNQIWETTIQKDNNFI